MFVRLLNLSICVCLTSNWSVCLLMVMLLIWVVCLFVFDCRLFCFHVWFVWVLLIVGCVIYIFCYVNFFTLNTICVLCIIALVNTKILMTDKYPFLVKPNSYEFFFWFVFEQVIALFVMNVSSICLCLWNAYGMDFSWWIFMSNFAYSLRPKLCTVVATIHLICLKMWNILYVLYDCDWF